MEKHRIDELLELVWTMREENRRKVAELGMKLDDANIDELVSHALEKNLVKVVNGEIFLKDEGEARAREIIRRHRLAERLFGVVLEIESQQVEASACEFEHILSSSVTDGVCAFLGHPPVCPHGKKIPRGECCLLAEKMVTPLVMNLGHLEVGDRARIVFITPRHHARLDKLSSFGVVPGSVVRLHQNKPSFVLEIGETTLALDEELARDIYVRKE